MCCVGDGMAGVAQTPPRTKRRQLAGAVGEGEQIDPLFAPPPMSQSAV